MFGQIYGCRLGTVQFRKHQTRSHSWLCTMWQYLFVWLVQCMIYIMIKFATWMTKIYLRSTSHEDRHFMMMPRKWLVRSVELFVLWTRKYIHYCIQVNLLNRSLYIARTLETATCSMFDSDASASQSKDTQTLLSDSAPLQEIVHTALHLRADLLGTPGHDCYRGIDLESVYKVIPNSLHLFLCDLFGLYMVYQSKIIVSKASSSWFSSTPNERVPNQERLAKHYELDRAPASSRSWPQPVVSGTVECWPRTMEFIYSKQCDTCFEYGYYLECIAVVSKTSHPGQFCIIDKPITTIDVIASIPKGGNSCQTKTCTPCVRYPC